MDRPRLAVVHSIPGRLRVRLPPNARTQAIEESVARLPGVTQCRWTPRTRSLLALYRPDEVGAGGLVDSIAAQADVESAPVMTGTPEPSSNGGSPVAAAVVDAVRGVNQRVRRATAGRITLGVLVPLALTLWAIRDATRGPMRSLPWSSALWYAHGLFRDYNLPSGD
jgi:Heavy metal associated domain 2